MWYLYIETNDGSPLFLKSTAIRSVNGEDNYDESWYESPLHATQFRDADEAIEHACTEHSDMSSAIMVMSSVEARNYL